MNRSALTVFFVRYLGLISLFLYSLNSSYSLPIGFGFNQENISYREIKTDHFFIYHDARVPDEAAMIANALEGAKPTLERWFGVSRQGRLPVISSAVSSHASFANFITDAIELQTLGDGDRDLFWHEYIHSMTYEHFRNFMGPAGSVVHLPWIPAWFLEGLAEAMSISVGSDIQASFERYQALTGRWPSFDRLHSLYSHSSFFLQGYATSGGFVAWLLRQSVRQKSDLQNFMKRLYRYTLPEYYVWSFNPFSPFMPMDQVLTDFLKKDGRSLYKEYKKAAREYWMGAKKGPLLAQLAGKRMALKHLSVIKAENHKYYGVFKQEDHYTRMELEFDENSGWMTRVVPTDIVLPDDPGSLHHIARPSLNIAVSSKAGETSSVPDSMSLVFPKESEDDNKESWLPFVGLRGDISMLEETPEKIVWLEQQFGVSRLCFVSKNTIRHGYQSVDRNQVLCPLQVKQPKNLRYLGSKNTLFPAIGLFPSSKTDRFLATELWFNLEEQTMVGNRNRLIVWNSTENSTRTLAYDGGGTPLQIAQMADDYWMLLAERDRRSLRKIDADGRCLAVMHMEDLVTQVTSAGDGSLVLGLQHGDRFSVLKIDPSGVKLKGCEPASSRSSPLIWAMQQNRLTDLPEAIWSGSPWKKPGGERDEPNEARHLSSAPGLNSAESGVGRGASAADSRPVSWRARPVLAFPWIGADDALGSQFGMVSVPLMDHLQNETLRLTALYGMDSRFPNTELIFRSTRFWPTIDLSLYRRQLWNGVCQERSSGRIYTSYLDEKGVHGHASFQRRLQNGDVGMTLGIRSGHLKRYLGPCPSYSEGRVNEPYIRLSANHRLGPASLSAHIKVKSAPGAINTRLDYHSLSAALGMAAPLPFLGASLHLGLEGGQTRGSRMPGLREFYQPLKTFIPGSGGGYNQSSFPLGGGGSLLAIRYGDTQARFHSALTLPVISQLDKQLWLFYMDSLNFTAFYNYGGAWNEGRASFQESLIKAHGYKLDLLFENKGVGFNISLGSGQVLGDSFQLYMTIGFDAFF
ncbi:MAG: hypothetical protein H6618_07465 [Deltaproteobacteria bacterium]|nr:hypothetical protein [Deltaproteobacteria bacterium]